jgi:D-3-phosphoglycerate dehydrogenase
MDQVMLAPHNANSSPAAWEAVHENTIRNLLENLGITIENRKSKIENQDSTIEDP